MHIIRHLLAILLLPLMVVVIIPSWLLRSFPAADALLIGPFRWISVLLGALLLLAGFTLFAWCVALFARVGRGTLAPWDPTQNLVAVGPYRYVRNPMISGVLIMLVGEALFFGSLPLALWAGIFFVINQTYFLLLEEPGLERRFGESYRLYKSKVPRWLPRLTPWKRGG